MSEKNEKSAKSATHEIMSLAAYYLILLIVYQVVLYFLGDIIVFDRFSSLILIIFIILPLFLIFTEIEIYGFKIKKELDEFKDSVVTRLDRFENTLTQSSNQYTTVIVDGKTSEPKQIDLKDIDNLEFKFKKEYEDAKR
ncbi:hypothetical protein LI82_08935 [Methanococcoides methylutens]|uniref:Uncharacterized protein n=1 Tax=Methanococcoides methylutens TaxID=2226 RepID=A0A099SY65_METMT|nr:hypothetical protein [Methanococcoides methylutens]KGK97875.1 hypothetical protein LI82_08935 [Methanococcoides methylutens]